MTIALTLCLVVAVAFVVADIVARAAGALLRSVITDPQTEALIAKPRRVVRIGIFLVTVVALAFPALKLVGFDTHVGGSPDALLRWVLDAGLRIAVIALVAYLIIRFATVGVARFERELSAGAGPDTIERAKRAQTLGRLLQKGLTALVLGIAGLMILRELGVDITPALTGAGILGLAIGFGAQTLVRDVISGFLLIMEDQVRVGDVAVVNGQGGQVEAINLRTLVLRDEQGTVHVFPNGEVKTLANMSKDFSYYVLTVDVSLDDNPDTISAAMRDAAAELMGDPAFRPHILEPLDVYGVDSFAGRQMTIKARIKTVPLKQWTVGRELRKRIARVFRERGIGTAVPQMQVEVRQTGPEA